MMISCEDPPTGQLQRWQLESASSLEADLMCRWLPNYKICVCIFSHYDFQSKWGGGFQAPDRICAASDSAYEEENGAVP